MWTIYNKLSTRSSRLVPSFLSATKIVQIEEPVLVHSLSLFCYSQVRPDQINSLSLGLFEQKMGPTYRKVAIKWEWLQAITGFFCLFFSIMISV